MLNDVSIEDMKAESNAMYLLRKIRRYGYLVVLGSIAFFIYWLASSGFLIIKLGGTQVISGNSGIQNKPQAKFRKMHRHKYDNDLLKQIMNKDFRIKHQKDTETVNSQQMDNNRIEDNPQLEEPDAGYINENDKRDNNPIEDNPPPEEPDAGYIKENSKRDKDILSALSSSECINVNVNETSLKVCLYNQQVHNEMADEIRDFVILQNEYLEWFVSYLRNLRSRDITFLDIGAGLGLYSIFAASTNVQVVAIEPWFRNLQKIQMSLKENGLSGKVKLVQTAIYDKMGYLQLNYVAGRVESKIVQEGDVETMLIRGGGVKKVVRTPANKEGLTRCINWKYLRTHFIHNEYIVIRVARDVFLYEIFNSAQTFFDTNSILAVFMDWRGVKHDVKLYKLIYTFLNRNGFQPRHRVDDALSVLDSEQSDEWPDNVVWVNKLFPKGRV